MLQGPVSPQREDTENVARNDVMASPPPKSGRGGHLLSPLQREFARQYVLTGGNATKAMLAYLATLLAIVVMTIAAAVICLTVDAETHFAQIVAALGFIGAAVTGLIGVIGTFRPKGQPAATTQSGDVNMGDKP